MPDFSNDGSLGCLKFLSSVKYFLYWKKEFSQMLTLFQNAERFSSNIAIIDAKGSYNYQELLTEAQNLAGILLQGQPDLNQTRVAFMVSPGFDYVKTQWAIWMAGGIAVPLCISYPLPSLQYVMDDTEAEILLFGNEYQEILTPIVEKGNIRSLNIESLTENKSHSTNLPEISLTRGAMILYTSGTTSLPKGVLTTHANIEAQISTLVKAWHWSQNDYTLGILPLHHVHGIINVLGCCMWSGACIQFIHPFSVEEVLKAFIQTRINVFMAVPTVYFKLIQAIESLSKSDQKELKEKMKGFRLMVSGSAALPVSVMEKWKSLSGHYLLERYGMTEIGMALSNPYLGERRAGHVGFPLPEVQIRIVEENNKEIVLGDSGEIQVKSPCVFKEYWRKPEATNKAFTSDGWFKTGDIATIEDGYYKLLGRDSVDIIKSGGYKISALEIEEVLRKHPLIKDCGVIGIPDEEWGELVAAGIVCSEAIQKEELISWLKERLPAYKIPRNYIQLEDLPRNAMGKVTKNELKKLF